MKVDKINLISLIIGVVAISLVIWGWSAPNSFIAEKGLQVIWGFLFWIISCVLTIIGIRRFRKHRKEVTFWIGLIINFLFCIGSIAIVLLLMIRVIFFGANV